jgi:hypothetical protein
MDDVYTTRMAVIIPPKVYAKNIPPRGYGTKKVTGGVSMRRMVGVWHRNEGGYPLAEFDFT